MFKKNSYSDKEMNGQVVDSPKAVEAAVVRAGSPLMEDDHLERLINSDGKFGRFQMYVFALACVVSYVCGMAVVAMTFVGYEPDNRCRVHPCDLNATNMHLDDYQFLNFTTPYHDEEDYRSRCTFHPYDLTDGNVTNEATCSQDSFDQAKVVRCIDGHIFNNTIFRSTIMTEFSLYCVTPVYKAMPATLYMFGMLLGAIIMGDVADRFGRKVAVGISSMLVFSSGIWCALVPNYPLFLLGKFLTGVGAVGLYENNFVLMVELIGVKYRTMVGMLVTIPFALGEATTGVLAYFIRDWRYLQLAITMPASLLLLVVWKMPESVRWLVTENRHKDAVVILKRMAKLNKTEISEESIAFIKCQAPFDGEKICDPMHGGDWDPSSPTATSAGTAGAVVVKTPPRKTAIDLLKHPQMRKRSFNMFFCWAVVTFMYYGLSTNSSFLPGNIFLNFILTMLIEIPSYTVAWLMLDPVGRKGSLIIMLFVGGIPCIINALLPAEYELLIMIHSLIGKFGASAAFSIVFMYGSELFPTDYRSVAIGSCSMFARMGGIFAPLIVQLGKNTPWLAPFGFGMSACVSGCLVLLLPETAGYTLTQTLAESEEFGREQGLFDCFHIVRENKKIKRLRKSLVNHK